MLNKKPILVVMAAGMGSRYGGLKQIDPVGPCGEILMDYALYDAKCAGFERVVFLISPEMEQEFKEVIADRIKKHVTVALAFQTLQDLPCKAKTPLNRKKPWGTAHAVYCCREVVDAPFAVVNADDYYGRGGFTAIYKHLCALGNDDTDFAMVGYAIENTMTENGHVARGICQVKDGMLVDIVERTHICMHLGKPSFSLDGGKTFTGIPSDSVASMNLWGFTPALFGLIEKQIPPFLCSNSQDALRTAELYLPEIVKQALVNKQARVTVYKSDERWYGMTYLNDRASVRAAIASMSREGKYPSPLWT